MGYIARDLLILIPIAPRMEFQARRTLSESRIGHDQVIVPIHDPALLNSDKNWVRPILFVPNSPNDFSQLWFNHFVFFL